MSGRSRKPVQVVLVPRHGKTPLQAYDVAKDKLAEQGFRAVRLIGFSIDRDKRTNSETFFLRIEVEPEPTAGPGA